MSTPPTTMSAAPATRRPPTSSVRRSSSADSPHAPQRLRGHERGDDGHATTVVRLEEADVRQAEAEAGGREHAKGVLRPGGASRVRASPRRAPDSERRRRRDRAAGRRSSPERWRTRLSRVANSSVQIPRENEAARAQVLRPPLDDERDAAADDQQRADDERRGTGSPSAMNATATATSGAAPTTTEVRDAPDVSDREA